MKTKFYTGKGDKGESDLGEKKVSKSSEYAEAIGALDEVNSWLGVCRSNVENEFVSRALKGIQESLFIAQAEVGALGAGHTPRKTMPQEKVKILEKTMKEIDRELPLLEHFVIPGEDKESSLLDYARALARHAERKVVNFHENEVRVSDELLAFINRLSSALFALARYVNHVKGIEESHPSYN